MNGYRNRFGFDNATTVRNLPREGGLGTNRGGGLVRMMKAPGFNQSKRLMDYPIEH